MGSYRARFSWGSAAAETILATYVALAVGYSIVNGLYPSVPFLLLFLYGFTAVAAGSWSEPASQASATARS